MQLIAVAVISFVLGSIWGAGCWVLLVAWLGKRRSVQYRAEAARPTATGLAGRPNIVEPRRPALSFGSRLGRPIPPKPWPPPANGIKRS